MRMWGVNPKLMCNQHLLGEHLEMHMFAGCITKGKKIDGYVSGKLVVIEKISQRHDELVAEMKARNMNHRSPLLLSTDRIGGVIDIKENEEELGRRCSECRKQMVDEHAKNVCGTR